MATEQQRPQLIRITVFAQHNPKLSESQFNEHWATKHGPLVAEWLQRNGIVKYVQYHTTSEARALLSMPTLSFDGVADFWVKDYKDFENAYSDPYYKDVVRKDEEYLFDMSTMRVTAGIELDIISDGKIVEDPHGHL